LKPVEVFNDLMAKHITTSNTDNRGLFTSFSFRGYIRRSVGDPPGPTVPPYAALCRFARNCPSTADDKRKGENPLPATLNV
jgi:hypothetical protein